jgi:putative tricarboxylic transport membrane protein
MSMDTLYQFLNGLQFAIHPFNLLAAFLGALMGTVVGVLPGLGPSSALSILIPLTMVLPSEFMIIVMAGIYYGAQYGGSTTSILLNIPGEVSSVPTCLDGYPLSRQGLGGVALGVAAIGSFFAGVIALVGLIVMGPALARQALRFGSPEYFGLMLVAFALVASLSGGSIAKGMTAGLIGYLLSLVGFDRVLGAPRCTFGTVQLTGGISLISIVTGLFAWAEILESMEENRKTVSLTKIGRILPSFKDLIRCTPSFLRGSVTGFLLGLLPGCSPAITTFFAYDIEKKCSKTPERFGKGALEGVAAPEAANNATAGSGFIPLFSLGIPPSPPLAILMGGLIIYGIQPGPLLFQKYPDLVWTVIASMFIGNAMLVFLNLPLVGLWVRLTRVPYGILAPIILLLCVVGTFTVRNSMFDVWVSLAFGVIGYFMRKTGWPAVPLILCYILGPIMEESFVESLMIFQGDFLQFFMRPLTVALFIIAALLMVFVYRSKRKENQVLSELARQSRECIPRSTQDRST